MKLCAVTLAYDGAAFSGSQRQCNGRTVQGEVERALGQLGGNRPEEASFPVLLAGRTDAGVHALGQVARVSLPQGIPVERLARALNGVMDRAVRAREAREVSEEFHPRYDARSREYRYRIECAQVPNPLLRGIVGHLNASLDVAAMREVAPEFLGQRDFAAWQSAGSPTKSTVREIEKLLVRESQAFGSQLIEIEIVANAFLYRMVRNIVGALMEAGQGRLTREDVRALTAGLERTACPPPAPPQGLCLMQVNY
jgi:tRNA pseudouridine38-40 synthase